MDKFLKQILTKNIKGDSISKNLNIKLERLEIKKKNLVDLVIKLSIWMIGLKNHKL